MAYAQFVGLTAAVVGMLGFVPYIRSILEKKTVPHRASWLVWAALGVITAASYYSGGARESAWLPAANAFAHIAVACLALTHGTGGWSKLDRLFLAGAASGLFLWYLTNSPLIALLTTIAVEAAGAIPTLLKTYRNPESEDKLAWSLFFAANAINLAAVTVWTPAIAAYPLYSFVASLAMVTLLYLGRRPPAKQTANHFPKGSLPL